ncbi:type VI secretion system protein TssA [Massilia sp. Se16.2.3]|nr:type VI secretion system protein TssA [Massilia sp. Se16.2.3]QNB00150.1 type VI secretion system protein TssA [Massilia sp. Se16.2.3]
MKRDDPQDDAFDALLLPISDASPGGDDLLHGPEFDAIAEARREDDPTLPRGVWTAELKRADWPLAARLCREALATRSKDLQVAAWLGEAWIALEGPGRRRACHRAGRIVVRTLVGIAASAAAGRRYRIPHRPLAWLDEHWSRALLVRVPLLRGSGVDAHEVTLAAWREALAMDNSERKAGDKKPAAAANAGVLTRGQVLLQVRALPWAELASTLAELEDWAASAKRLHDVLERQLAKDAPPLHRLRGLLDEARRVVQGWMSERPERPAPVPPPQAPIAEAAKDMPVPLAPVAPPGQAATIASRSEAYARLRELADYLAQLEPHSPVPALLRRAVDWGAMPFDQLLRELTHNNNEMHKVLLRDPIE